VPNDNRFRAYTAPDQFWTLRNERSVQCAHNGEPVLETTFRLVATVDADTMLSIWPMVMPVIGSCRCGEPGGWPRMRDRFINSFGDNPGSTFPNR